MTIFTASPDTVDTIWVHARPHVERFSQETLLATPEDILADLKEGLKQLWLVEVSGEVDAVAVTHVYETMKGRVCCIWAACGTLGIDGVKDAFGEIEKWAETINCVAVEVRGRKGWVRVLPGFKETGVLLEKDLRRIN